MEGILETITQSDLVQLDSERNVFFETPSTDIISSISQCFEDNENQSNDTSAKPHVPVSDSDSGDSLFLTQSVTPVNRTVKRRHSSERPALPFSVESDDEHEGDGNIDNRAHEEDRPETVAGRESDSGLTDDDLFGGPGKMLALPAKRTRRSCSQPRKRRPAPARPRRTEFPFLSRSHSGRLLVYKNQVLVNSEVGGFFKCVRKINMGHGEGRKELNLSLSFPVVEEDGLGEGNMEEDHDDIRLVDTDFFIEKGHKRNRQTWLPKSRWKTRLSSSTSCVKGNKGTKEKTQDKKKSKESKKSPVSKDAEDITEPQDTTETLHDTEVSSLSVKTSQSESRKQETKHIHPATRTSPRCSSIGSFLIEQEQHSERQLEVLATCTQAESLGLHYSSSQRSEGSEEERVVEETQRPDSDQSPEETDRTPAPEMLEEESRERDEDGMYLEQISFRELQERDNGTSEDMQENDDNADLDTGVCIASPELFEPQDTQTNATMACSPLIDCNEDRDANEEGQECCVVPSDETDSLNKEKTSKGNGSEIILEAEVDSHVDKTEHSEVPRTSPSYVPHLSETASPVIDEIRQAKNKNHNSTSADDGVTRSCPDDSVQFPTLSPADERSGLEVSADSHPDEKLITGEQAEMAVGTEDSPLFNYGGLSMLRRRKRKTTNTSEPSHSSHSDTVQNDGLSQFDEVSGQEKVEESGLLNEGNQGEENVETGPLEEPLDALPENSICVDAFQDRSVQPLSHDTERTCVEMSNQIPNPTSDDRVSATDPEQRTVTGVCSTEINTDSIKNLVQLDITALQCDERPEPGHDTTLTQSVDKETQETRLEPDNIKESLNNCDTASNAETQVSCLDLQEGDLVTPKKRKQDAEDHVPAQVEIFVTVEAPEVIEDSQQFSEMVPERKGKTKERQQVVLENADADASQVENSEQIEATEMIPYSEQEATDSIPVKTVKKKRKRQQVGKDDVAVNDSQVEILEQIETGEVSQHSELQSVELVPEEDGKKKKKKRKIEQFGEADVTVEASQLETVVQVESFEAIQHSEQQATELLPEKKQKKKKKKRSGVVEESAVIEASQMESSEQTEATEMIPYSELEAKDSIPSKNMKKKRRRTQSGEYDVPVNDSQVETVEPVQEVEVSVELVPQEKVKKKKKKKREQIDEDDVTVEASQLETAVQVEAVQVIQHSEQQAAELLPENKLKRKKKKRSGVVEESVALEASQKENTEQIEATEMIQCSEQEAIKSVPTKKVKKIRKREPVGKDDVAVNDSQAEPVEQIEEVGIVQHSKLQSVELVPEGNGKKRRKRRRTQSGKDDVVVNDSQAETVEQVEDVEIIQHFDLPSVELVPEDNGKTRRKRRRTRSGKDAMAVNDSQVVETLQQDENVEVIQHSELQSIELVPQEKVKKKKKRKREQVLEDDVTVEASQLYSEQQATELVPEKILRKKKKKRPGVDENMAIEANQKENPEQVEATEAIQHPDHIDTESVPEKKCKNKKKGEQVVKGDVALETGQVVSRLQTETPEVLQSSELVPEKKVKKKKNKREKRVEDNVFVKASQVATAEQVLGVIDDSEQQTTEVVSENKAKKKKNKRERFAESNVFVKAAQEARAEQVLDMIHDSEQQTTLTLKKGKKKKKPLVVENVNVVEMEMIWGSELRASELVPEETLKKKKKKKKPGAVEEYAAVETSQIETTEDVEAAEMIQESEQQTTESVPEKTKKKKKKKQSGVVGENVTVATTQAETTEQAGALKVMWDSEQQTSNLVLEKKLKTKKKKKKPGVVEEHVDMEQFQPLERVQDCERKTITQKKVKKKKGRTLHEQETRATPCVTSEKASVSTALGSLTTPNSLNPRTETDVSERGNTAEISEKFGYCSPGPDGSAFLTKKKKKRKEKENSTLPRASSGTSNMDQDKCAQRRKSKQSVARLEPTATPVSDKTTLFRGSKNSQSSLEDPPQLKTKKKKNNNKRRAESDRDASSGVYGEDAASQESLGASQSPPSEAVSKKKKKKIKRDSLSSGQNVCDIKRMQYVRSLAVTTGLEAAESPPEVSDTLLGKEQDKEDRIPSSGLFLNSGKKKRKRVTASISVPV